VTTVESNASGRSKLFFFVALFCAFVVFYASLQPFSGWTSNDESLFAFLLTFSTRTTRSDLIFNALAYLPLGFALYAVWPTQWHVRSRFAATLLLAIALSIAVEALQTWLPTRVSSVYDTIANVIGAMLGAGVATYLLARTWLVRTARWTRETLFIKGATGDLKILLLFVWLIAQVNPGIPLFGATFHPGMDGAFDAAVIAVELAQVAAALVGIGLFTDLAMRKRWYGGIALVTMVASAVTLKTIIAEWVLTPVAWESWLRPGHALGIATGPVLLMLLFWLPRSAKSVLAGIALLSSVLIPLLLPDLVLRGAPLAQFSWNYGQLLNLNGLTRTIVMVWPFVATLLLLVRFGEESKREAAKEIARQVHRDT
jgi:VanZ family protein